MIEELPQSWQKVELAHICELVNGDRGKNYPSKDKLSKEGLPFVNAGNLKNNRILNESMNFIDEHRFNLLNSGKFGIGDILFCIRGSLGKVALNIHIESGAIASSLIIVRPHQFIMQKYVLYYLTSPLTHNMINKFDNGTAQPNLAGADLGRFEFPLPPLNEQKRIVAKIEELFSELDKGIESLKTAREQLKVYRQAVLKHAFEQKGGRKTTLGNLLSYITSGSRGWAQYYSEAGELFIRAQNLKYDHLDLTECAYVSIPNKTEGTRTKVQQGDLLITITGANVTKSALIEQDLGTAYVSQHVALCRPIKEEILPKFLYWFVIAEAAGRKQLSSEAYGAGKPGLNLDNIKSVQVTIPSYEQQVAVVKIIEENLSVCEELEQEIERNIQRSEALRQSILKKAFSGKLVAQDPNDEPASVLLERIRAEKEAQSGKKKPKQEQGADSILELAAIQTGVVQTCFWP